MTTERGAVEGCVPTDAGPRGRAKCKNESVSAILDVRAERRSSQACALLLVVDLAAVCGVSIFAISDTATFRERRNFFQDPTSKTR